VLSVSSALWCVIFWTTGFEVVGLIVTGVLVQLTSITLQWIPSNASAACTQLWAAAIGKVVVALLHGAGQLPTRLADLTHYPHPMQMGRKTCYYQPLTSSDIRLLKIVRRRPFTPLQCELAHVEMHSSTLYDAISYTWGDMNKTKGLIVNGEWLACPAAVQNIVLDRASYLCERYMWIDSLILIKMI
jgi:hypothetical protein